MKKFFVVIASLGVYITAADRLDARIVPSEKARGGLSALISPEVNADLTNADYEKIIEETKTLEVEWQRSALELIPQIIKRYGSYIDQVAERYKLTPHILAAVVIVESGGRHNAVSKLGARGCMQVMPATKKDLAVLESSSDCRTDIRNGAKYLAQLRDRYEYKTTSGMLAAYIDGPTGARNYTSEDLKNHKYLKKILFVTFHIHRMYKTYVR